jgi:hypothetical protein
MSALIATLGALGMIASILAKISAARRGGKETHEE